MSRESKAWDALRKAGGSIFAPDGSNLSGDSEGQSAFEEYLKGLCGSSAKKLDDLLTKIEEAAADAAHIAAMNAIPTTDPKCYSKPIVRLSVGCEAETSMEARNKHESDCSG
jgi:hypothetical protein